MEVNRLNRKIPEYFEVINPHTKRIIAKFGKGEVEIIDRLTKQNYSSLGLNIPPHLRESFENKQIIQLDDEHFYQAFITAGIWELKRSGCEIVPIIILPDYHQ